MIEMIENYGPEILQYLLTGVLIIVAAKIRSVSDTNLLDVFQKVKNQALDVSNKNIDISNTIEKVGSIVNLSTKMIENLETDLQAQMTNISTSVLAFQESEIYTKMINGLETMNDLKQIIDNKDDLIAILLTELKSINQRLGVIENERKL